MRINGKVVDGPSYDVVVFPRIDGDVVFKCQCVLDYEPFLKLVPAPEPPKIMRRGETQYSVNLEDSTYTAALEKYSELRTHWMILKSLEATDDLGWDTVDMAEPDTWKNYPEELLKAGFTDSQIARIINTCAAVNGLNEKMMDEAKQRFLAGLRAKPQQSSPTEEPASI